MPYFTIEGIVNQVKELENDNSSGGGLFISGLINRFCEIFAMNVDHSSLIFSSSVAVTSGSNYINLGGNFLRPIDEKSFYVANTNYQYQSQRYSQGVRNCAGNFPQDRYIYLIGGRKFDYFSAYINAPLSETITYWYQGLHTTFSAASEVPRIPSEYIIEGTRIMYKESNGIITKRDMDAYIYQILSQANSEDAKLDRKISAYIYTDPEKSKQSFRG